MIEEPVKVKQERDTLRARVAELEREREAFINNTDTFTTARLLQELKKFGLVAGQEHDSVVAELRAARAEVERLRALHDLAHAAKAEAEHAANVRGEEVERLRERARSLADGEVITPGIARLVDAQTEALREKLREERAESQRLREQSASHTCSDCGALWRLNDSTPEQPEGSWSLVSAKAGPCCDNAEMGLQIQPIGAWALLEEAEEHAELLAESLGHMEWCRSCAEGSWDNCEGGRAARALLNDKVTP